MDKTDNIIEKIQKLLSKAASTNFSAERDTALAMADKLMTVHAIESFAVEMHKPADQRKNKPEVRNFKITLGDKPEGVDEKTWADLRNIMCGLFGEAARFCRCRQVNLSWSAQVIGYTDDLAYLQELYLSLQMQMLTALSPRVDPSQDYINNLVSLKEAGLKWTEIYARLRAGGFFEDREWSHALGDGCHVCQEPKCQRTNCKNRRKPVKYKHYREPTMDTNAVRNGRAAGSTVDLGGARVTSTSTKGIAQ